VLPTDDMLANCDYPLDAAEEYAEITRGLVTGSEP
jgi:hypothetical protein